MRLRRFLVDELDDVQHLAHPLARERGSEDKRHAVQERRLLAGLLLELVRGLVVLLGEVPLVDDDDQSAARFPGHVGDLEILVVHSPSVASIISTQMSARSIARRERSDE